jgi:hypothetical protein
MPTDDRDVLDALKFELHFLQQGGYGRLPRFAWRAPLIFEDSPICLNYDAREDRAPCRECLLMRFVPPEQQSAKVPCRHIPLDSAGQSLHSLYDSGTQLEIEEALEGWLKETINRLEQERFAAKGREAAANAAAH